MYTRCALYEHKRLKNLLIPGHPFQEILDRESTALLPVDDVNGFVQDAVVHLFHAADLLRGLFLVANVFESLKFCVFLYAMTYVGEAFNLMTLVIIAAVSVFSIPKVKKTKRRVGGLPGLSSTSFSASLCLM